MSKPPLIAQWLLGLVLHSVDRDVILGDLEETYSYKAQRVGLRAARHWYWFQAIRSVPLLTGRSIYWNCVMLKNYFKVALRNLRKQKGYSFINLTGLAMGLASSFFVFLWIQDELAHDRFLPEVDKIHQVLRNVPIGGQVYTWEANTRPLAQVLEDDFPEIEHATLTRFPSQFVVTFEEQSFREEGNFAGKAFFEVFDFTFLQGDSRTALDDVSAIVISDRFAQKIFGERWQEHVQVLGKTLTIDHRKDFKITGVIADIPHNSSLQFDVLLPVQDFIERNDWTKDWGNNGFPIYVKLQEDAVLPAVNEKIEKILTRYEEGSDETIFLQPFGDRYLYSDYNDGQLIGGRIEYVRIFSIIAIFLLLIAAINFTNLATARSTQRAREVGVRKAIGANQQSLIAQFLGESMFLTFTALLLALLLVVILLPFFNELTDKQISLFSLNSLFLPGILGVTILVGFVAGSYPALYLSSFNPLTVLRGKLRPNAGAALLRKGLVVVQFSLSVLLIVSTLAVYQQIHFIHNRDLGLDRDNIIYLAQEGALSSQYDVVKQELMKGSGISQVTSTSASPLNVNSSTGGVRWAGREPDDDYEFYILGANYDFAETMRMTLVAGRTFSKDYAEENAGYIINEEMASILGNEALGTELSFWGGTGPVIGIVKDFEMNSFYVPNEPVIIRLDVANTDLMYVRSLPGQTTEALTTLERVFTEFNPGYPFDYGFLDQDFEETYRSETILGKLANIFAFIAIFVSCLGLFGLVSYTAEQRTKEIGVRKVLGASVSNIVRLLTGEITALVLLGIVIALPVAYWAIQRWLSNFEYHIETGIGMFALAGVAAISIALLTVSYQSIKAAKSDPVKSLKYE